MQWRKVCVVSGGRGSDASREYTCYHISCTESGERGRSWTVTQRYSVFEALRQQLLSSADERLVADIQSLEPLFPPKEGVAAWILPPDPALGAARQSGLLAWLQAVHTRCPAHPAVLGFLAPPRPGDAQPEEPRPSGQEAGTDFYLPEDGVEGFDMLEAMGSATPRAVNQLLPSGSGR